MKLIDPSVEIIHQENPKKQIELAGRTCYKSESKITEDSYNKFFDMIVSKQHLSVLEHGTIYLKVKIGSPVEDEDYMKKIEIVSYFKKNPYSRIIKTTESLYDSNNTKLGTIVIYNITTNYRVIKEMPKLKYLNRQGKFELLTEDVILSYICEPNGHERRITAKFICSRSISHELVRHRAFSFSQESQRYVNYYKNNEITFIKPEYTNPKFLEALQQSEDNYLYLIAVGWKPEQAREVLVNATKTEIVVTGYLSDWQYFFKLRCSKQAHPEMRRLANQLKEQIDNEFPLLSKTKCE